MRAFERQKDETQPAYQAFQKYLELGPERTLVQASDAIYGRPSKGPRRWPAGQVKKWADRFDWRERAQAWDDLLQMARLEAVEQAERDRIATLAERETKLDEGILALKEEILPKLQQMARFPLVRTRHESEDGKEITHVYPARWSFNTLIKAIEVIDTTPERIDFTSGGQPFDFTFVLDRPGSTVDAEYHD